MINSRSWAYGVLLLWVPFLHAQETGGPAPIIPDTTRLSTVQFDRTLQTFLWNGTILYGLNVNSIDIDFKQRLQSRLIRTGQKTVQDEVLTNLNIAAPVNDRWQIMGTAASSVLSDNRQLDLNNLSQHQILLGPRVVLSDGISATALGGYELNAQEQQQDRGFSYLARLQGNDVRLEDFLLSFAGRSGQSSLKPRSLRADSAMVSLSRDFSPQAGNILSLQYSNQQREFYTGASQAVQQDFSVNNNIFRRTALEIGVNDTVVYRTGESTTILFQGGILGRTIARGYRYKSFSDPSGTVLDERIRETNYAGSVGLHTRLTSWLESHIALNYEEREERHSVLDDPSVSDQVFDRQEASATRLANIARRTTLEANAAATVDEKTSLNLSGSASILRYDTPDSLNTDDRDELLVVMGIGAEHRFSRQLRLGVQVDATLGHLVYLSGFQSANNNWNRILRLKTIATWSPGRWLISTNSSEVLANYTVYDFEDQIASVKSFSFRQASWSDSTTIALDRSVNLLFEGSLSLYERGVLTWKDFKERPENYFVEQSYWPQVLVRIMGSLQMMVGYRYFSQTRYRYEGRSRLFDRKISNEGPTVSARWMGPSGSIVRLQGWRETQHYAEGGKLVFSNMSLTVGMAL
jgi:hypothetical protein